MDNVVSSQGGIVHTYLGYNPQRYPMPATEPPDMVSPAFEHLMAYGTLDYLTEEQLAEMQSDAVI